MITSAHVVWVKKKQSVHILKKTAALNKILLDNCFASDARATINEETMLRGKFKIPTQK